MDPRPWHARYDAGVPASIPDDVPSVPELLRDAAQRFPGRTAVRFQNATLSWRALDDAVARFAGGLAALGVEPGDRVAIQLPNLPQTVIAFLGTLRAGAVAVLTNPLAMPPEIERQWTDAGCKVAVVADFLWPKAALVRGGVPVREWIVASIPEYLAFPLRQLAPMKLRRTDPPLVMDVPTEPHVHRFRRFVDRSRPATSPLPALDDLAALQYTGGTTGASKGAMLTHGNFARQARQLVAWMPELVPGEEVFLAALPCFHVFGLTVGIILPVALGAVIVVEANPRDTARLIAAVNRHRVTIFPVVPGLVHAIACHDAARTLEVGTLKLFVSGSAPLPEDTLRRFEEITGGRVVEGFGLTEASPVTHVNPAKGTRKVNHIGLPLPSTDCRLVSLDGSQDVAPGSEGELLIRGPQVMRGYWNRPGETAEALRDGWLHTGDLAVMDDEGYFRIVGRKKEMIVVGGFKVYPDEVDRVLAEHPDVLEAATIGVPDDRRGEIVKSFVVLRDDAHVEPEALRAFCRERMAAYKVPREVERRDSLPKSTILKVLRRQLVEEELRKRGT